MEQTGKPPENIPPDLWGAYTMGQSIPVFRWYFDDRSSGEKLHIPLAEYDRVFAELDAGTFSYYGNEVQSFYGAFTKYPVADKKALIWGLIACNCDAMAVREGAEHVWAVDYNPVVSDHPKVTGLSHAELAELPFRFDYAISYSSFEHDGLGRYGDPLNPDGDLEAMRTAWEYLAPGGILLLGIPLGADALVWNAHRIYGPLRLPLMLRGFSLLDVFSVYPGLDFGQERLGELYQALMVLRKRMPEEDAKSALFERLRYARALAKDTPRGLANGRLLQAILEMQFNSEIF